MHKLKGLDMKNDVPGYLPELAEPGELVQSLDEDTDEGSFQSRITKRAKLSNSLVRGKDIKMKES